MERSFPLDYEQLFLNDIDDRGRDFSLPPTTTGMTHLKWVTRVKLADMGR